MRRPEKTGPETKKKFEDIPKLTKEEFKGYMEDEVFNYARKTGPSKSLSSDGNFVLVKS